MLEENVCNFPVVFCQLLPLLSLNISPKINRWALAEPNHNISTKRNKTHLLDSMNLCSVVINNVVLRFRDGENKQEKSNIYIEIQSINPA